MDFSKLLNERQLEAVQTSSQFVRIIAGAGTGKTRVLTYQIAYLISERLVEPSQILAITFTNKVAGEMRERAINLVPEAREKLRVLTFHSFCARFLRREITAIGYPGSFTIFDDDDQTRLVKAIAVEEGYRKNDDIVKQTLNFIASHKCVGSYPEQITITKERFPQERECLRLYGIYERKMKAMYALDFDDLLLKAIEILEQFDDVRQKWVRRVDHILIDEFQDTNDVQYKLVKLLMKPSTNLYVVGDPDQTIYTWRGANQSIILDIDKKYAMETIILDRNYRSTPKILRIANRLIDHNRLRVKKDLFSHNPEGRMVKVNRALRQVDEAAWVSREILALQRDEGADFRFRNIAVLYRANYLTLPFEKEFNRVGMPIRIFGGIRFYQRQEIKDVIAYFRLLINKKDDVSFERIINVPRRGIGEKTIETLKKEAFSQRLSLYEYLQDIANHDTELKTKSVIALDQMIKTIERFRLRVYENLEAFSDILKEYIIDLGYFEELRHADEEYRLENVQTLFDDMLAYIKDNPATGFEDYLENIALTSAQDEIEDGDYISLMTVHTAKGLEFKHVFVIGLNEGIFPSLRTINEEAYLGLEEERRLCYVAFTRAKQGLYLSCSGDFSYVLNGRLVPSRFFVEAGITFERRLPTSDIPVGSIQGTMFKSERPGPVAPLGTNLSDWRIGDRIEHANFGSGEVVDVIDKTIIEVEFESCGRKKLIANHPSIRRLDKVGGLA
ncbi:MAG: UvrD-helicase domain-containing protein [Bacilli bacterium]|jgi:DNA helicase-2/ATP-dependent DNA helicase PcrA